MKNKAHTASGKRKKHLDRLSLICWIIVPQTVVVLLVLDGVRLYPFNTERLLVIGICIGVVLIPFFNEITVKNISFKKAKRNTKSDQQ